MRSISESILSAPAIEIAEVDARDKDDIGRSRVAAVANWDCPRSKLPPNFDEYLSPGPSTELVPSERERAHLMGPFLPGRIVRCERDRLRALRHLGACETVAPLRVSPSRGDPSRGRQRVVAAFPFLLPLLFCVPLPPSPSSPSPAPSLVWSFSSWWPLSPLDPPAIIGTATLTLDALLQGCRVVLVSN